MAIEVLMPVVTEEGEDGVVTAWFINEGSAVTAGQLIAEVQAEKVAQEVWAPVDGVVGSLVGINQPVPQGAPICTVGDVGEEPVPPREPPVPRAATAAEEPVGVRASPAARRRAKELGIELSIVAGAVPDRRITEADVEAAAAEASPAGVEPTWLRAVIARNVRRSHSETAPVTLTTSAEMTDEVPQHITAWVVKAAAVALRDHPQLNGTRDGDRFLPASVANIAIAVQTDAGLTAPVLRDPGEMTLNDLAAAIADLAARAREKQLDTEDFQGGTFAVTNLGSYGIDAFTPLIDWPQLAILGVGALRTVPGFAGDGRVVPRQVLTLSLTFDHAFVDGAPAAAFLAAVRDALEQGGLG